MMVWTRVITVKLAVTVPMALEAVRVMGPGASGVTVVEMVPVASVEMVQVVAAPQELKRTEPVAEKVTAVLGMGVMPSGWRALTTKAVGAGVLVKSWPEGAETRMRVGWGAA